MSQSWCGHGFLPAPINLSLFSEIIEAFERDLSEEWKIKYTSVLSFLFKQYWIRNVLELIQNGLNNK